MFRVVLFMIALAAGGLAAWLALAMQNRPATATTVVQAAPPAPTQDVLVASADLAPGHTLTKESMRWQSWPESALNSAYIGKFARPDAVEALAGSVVRSHIIAGEPLRDEKLLPPNAGFLSMMLPSGKRAVAVRISAENTAGGFVLPNDRVDVINTVARQSDGQKDSEGQREHVSRTIVRNVRVLAIDQSVDERSKDEKTKSKAVFVGKTATLELDSIQAEIITAGEAAGTLSLALRSASDNAEMSPPVAQQKAMQAVHIIRGGRTNTVEK